MNKYRIWDKQEKRMLYLKEKITVALGGITGEDVQLIFGEDFHSDFWEGEVKDFELLEFTGLTDKDEKEVYEGDILQETFMDKVLEWSLWQVIKEQGAFGVRPLTSGEDPAFRVFHEGIEGAFSLARYSVIGNIYETPAPGDVLYSA